jgi:alkylation response protein AidB-like acyl-CoA dehydrogenase
MDFDWPDTALELKAEAAAWLTGVLPPGWIGTGTVDDLSAWMVEWRAKLAEGRWLGLSWPEEYGGRGLGEIEAVAVVEEFARHGVPWMGSNDPFSIGMLGNTILHLGTEAQKQHFLPRILAGVDLWCQGYSEPEAGSE